MPPRLRASFAIVLALALFLPLAAACGGDDGASAGENGDPSATETPGAPSNDDRAGGPEPSLDGPASQYAPLLDEMGSGYFTELRETFVLDTENYAGVSLFTTETEGRRLLEGWGYQGGYQTGFEPERREVDVLTGKFYASVEVHLFEEPEGAQGF